MSFSCAHSDFSIPGTEDSAVAASLRRLGSRQEAWPCKRRRITRLPSIGGDESSFRAELVRWGGKSASSRGRVAMIDPATLCLSQQSKRHCGRECLDVCVVGYLDSICC